MDWVTYEKVTPLWSRWFICVQYVIDEMLQGDSLFWDTRTKTADLPLVPEDFFEKDDAAKEEAREGVEEPKEGRELKISRRRLTAAMRNFTVADFTPDRWNFHQ